MPLWLRHLYWYRYGCHCHFHGYAISLERLSPLSLSWCPRCLISSSLIISSHISGFAYFLYATLLFRLLLLLSFFCRRFTMLHLMFWFIDDVDWCFLRWYATLIYFIFIDDIMMITPCRQITFRAFWFSAVSIFSPFYDIFLIIDFRFATCLALYFFAADMPPLRLFAARLPLSMIDADIDAVW